MIRFCFVCLFMIVSTFLSRADVDLDAILRQRDEYGFYAAFDSFVEAAQRGDRRLIAKSVSRELQGRLGDSFEVFVPEAWRLGDCQLRASPKHILDDGRVVIVEAVVERRNGARTTFHVMYWIKRDDQWTFLNFPFWDAGMISAFHALTNESFSSLAHPELHRQEETAQPGATDNPEGAQ